MTAGFTAAYFHLGINSELIIEANLLATKVLL